MRINAILAALALLLAWPVYSVYSEEQTEDFVKDSDIPMLFPGFSADQVRVIQIARRYDQDFIIAQNLQQEQQFESLWFVRQGEGWVLKNSLEFSELEMDGRLIERDILEHIAAIKLDRETIVPIERVTDEFRNEQQLTPETGLVITCMRGPQGPTLASLILGKSTRQSSDKSALDGYFVRRFDARDVIIYEPKSQDWMISMRASDWADKNIHEFLKSEVAEFYLRNAMGEVGFQRKASGKEWVAIPERCLVSGKLMQLDNLAVRSADVFELVDQFKQIRAEGFRRVKTIADEGGNEVEVRAVLRDGTEYVLWVGVLQDKMSVAISSNHGFQFNILNAFVNVYRQKDPKDLFAPTR